MPKNLTEFEELYLGLSSKEFEKIGAYSESQTSSAWAMVYAELILHLFNVIASLFYFRIIYPTNVIHPNLKFILIIQCLAILMSALIRLLFVVPVKLLTGDIFWVENEFRLPLVEYLLDLPMYCRIFLGHVIILERTFATLFAKRYQKSNGKLFSFIWLSIVLLVTLFNLLYEEEKESKNEADEKEEYTTLFAVINALVWTILSLVETILFAFIWYYNKNKLNHSFATPSPGLVLTKPRDSEINYDLAKRYQYLENMRTTFQLGPTLIIYFLIQLNTAFNQCYHYFQFVPDDYEDEIIAQWSNIAVAFFNLLILISTIFFHPILRENFKKMLCCYQMSLTRVQPAANINNNISMISFKKSNSNSSSTGKKSTAADEAERHYKMLTNLWEKH